MIRGRHKKGKEKEFNTQVEILGTIRKELHILLAIYESQSSYNLKDALLASDFTSTKKHYNQLDALASIHEKKHHDHYLKTFCR